MSTLKKATTGIGILAFLIGATVFITRQDAAPEAAAEAATVTVYKSPTCSCCAKWVTHLEENGFTVNVMEMPDVTPMKGRLGVPPELRSCHTGVVEGYVLEGHVPADLIQRMLEEKPEIAGLAVPGMPIGSPGMEVEGQPNDAYDIVAFTKDGQRSVFASR
jgi:hypothetical protein